MKIVTGYAGEAHITSNDDQGLLQGIFGSGNYILPVRDRFAATLVSSNELQISDGEGVLQGVHFRVEPETSDSVVIENGSQGMQRIDLVCAKYERDPETGIETMSWVNHKGTPAASNPATPSITAGDLLVGDTLAEFPIYSIRLDGLTVESVTLVATIVSPQSLLGDTSISGIGDGTVTGALSALNSNLDFTIKSFSASPYTISANSAHGFTADDFNVSTPAGYEPMAVVYYSTGQASCHVYSVNARALGTGRMMSIMNTGTGALTISPGITIMYVKSATYHPLT